MFFGYCLNMIIAVNKPKLIIEIIKIIDVSLASHNWLLLVKKKEKKTGK